ncbi:SigE family RNA polymerase sigma factor [Micromonospora sp. NPDC049559]|uniref:SigE family RNA polymerase sigma factor n=1 Tax=Micromonospora sp. NPDC049559 TaxID=3155923 RepID=UPI0034149379
MSTSFDDFYSAHFGGLVAQLRAGTNDLAEAQDVVQEAFCRAWGRWDRVGRYEDPLGWIRRVAWNLAISRWRRSRTALRFLAGQRPAQVPGPGPERLDLDAALARLPLKQRRAVALHYLAGLTTAEIARECGVSDSTVRSWLHRARAALMKDLSNSTEEADHGYPR